MTVMEQRQSTSESPAPDSAQALEECGGVKHVYYRPTLHLT